MSSTQKSFKGAPSFREKTGVGNGKKDRDGSRIVMKAEHKIVGLNTKAYRFPLRQPESDGTLEWDSTTMVIVEAHCDSGQTGFGYIYGHVGCRRVIEATLKKLIIGQDPLNIEGLWHSMQKQIRNFGRDGIVASAISAVDIALWDLKAKILKLPLATLLGAVRTAVPVYGSGGFTSYTPEEMQEQFSSWIDQGITRFKIKVGTHPFDDVARIERCWRQMGDSTKLKQTLKETGREGQIFIDANGAYERKQAVEIAQKSQSLGVKWFEEPVPMYDRTGLRLCRDQMPPGICVAAGEYGYDLDSFRHLLADGCVDVLQADATRAGGVTGFMKAAVFAEGFNVPLSAHCAPLIHTHLGAAAKPLIHIEYFHDHVQIETRFFEGFAGVVKGELHPNFSKAGLGVEFKFNDAEKFLLD